MIHSLFSFLTVVAQDPNQGFCLSNLRKNAITIDPNKASNNFLIDFDQYLKNNEVPMSDASTIPSANSNIFPKSTETLAIQGVDSLIPGPENLINDMNHYEAPKFISMASAPVSMNTTRPQLLSIKAPPSTEVPAPKISKMDIRPKLILPNNSKNIRLHKSLNPKIISINQTRPNSVVQTPKIFLKPSSINMKPSMSNQQGQVPQKSSLESVKTPLSNDIDDADLIMDQIDDLDDLDNIFDPNLDDETLNQLLSSPQITNVAQKNNNNEENSVDNQQGLSISSPSTLVLPWENSPSLLFENNNEYSVNESSSSRIANIVGHVNIGNKRVILKQSPDQYVKDQKKSRKEKHSDKLSPYIDENEFLTDTLDNVVQGW